MASFTTRNPFSNPSLASSWAHNPLQPSSMSNLNAAANCAPAPDEPAILRITQAEHDVLVELSRRYTNLRSNLISLGADPEIIEKYSNENSISPSNETVGGATAHSYHMPAADGHSREHEVRSAVSSVAFPGKHTSVTRKPMSAKADIFRPSGLQTRVSTWMNKDNEDPSHSPDSPENDEPPVSHTPSNAELGTDETPRNSVARHAKRSLRLDNLTVTTGISDIAAAIRGGQILEIYQRYKEKAAVVSFVYEHEAQAFYDYTRKNDLYIKSKRVDVSWNDFQKTVSGQLAWSIRGGATRNFIVRQCDSFQTPESIKEDLEHIHDLRVISVEFTDRDCYIKTNSISGAVFARTCMSSRLRYRHCRMEWDLDECTDSPTDGPKKIRYTIPSPPQRSAKPVNRYEMLSVDRDV